MKKLPGSFQGLGTKWTEQGMEFTFAAAGEKLPAVLFYDRSTKKLIERLEVQESDRIGDVCSVTVAEGDWDSLCYLLEIDGEAQMDPYAREVLGREHWKDTSRLKTKKQLYGGFEKSAFSWKHKAPELSGGEMVCYKLHMRGLTMASALPREQKGNYLGILAKLPELAELGVTSLEFMPLYDFEEVLTDKINYWGYGDAFYFAPKASYFGGTDPVSHMKEMVDAIHGYGMECVLEMAFAQGTSQDLMVDALIYWTKTYRVDGFHLVGCNLPIERIAQCPYLKRVKIFYDHFPWELLEQESGRKHLFVYNDDFLYALRRMQNHMEGSMTQFADQTRRQNARYGFVNYAANTSGFTLWDAYSYGEKHNEENGEENRDGNPLNFSNNYGWEGPTKNKSIQRARMRQMRNAIASVMLSQGVPLLLAGDENANTQKGNNNPYCQDNRVGWVTYSSAKEKLELREFTRKMIAFRKEHPVLRGEEAMRLNDYKHQGIPDLSYHGREPWMMGLSPEQRAVGMLYCGAYAGKDQPDLYVCYNFHYEPVSMALPRLPGKKVWRLVMNTVTEEGFLETCPICEEQVEVEGGSVCILMSE